MKSGRCVSWRLPKTLKLNYGERSVVVEYGAEGKLSEEVVFLDTAEGKDRLRELIGGKQIVVGRSMGKVAILPFRGAP